MHTSSYMNMEQFIKNHLPQGKRLRIADIGSQDVGQNSSYKPLFSLEHDYVGCDMVPGHNVDVVLKNPYHWKELKSKSFDVVISGQAFEHIPYVWITMSEISRILKEDGLCCIIAPSNGILHRYPLDCWRFYEDGFRALAQYTGLKTVEVITQRTKADCSYFDPIWQDTVFVGRKEKWSMRTALKQAV